MHYITAVECSELAYDVNEIIMAALNEREYNTGATNDWHDDRYPYRLYAGIIRLYFDRSGLIVGAFCSQLTKVSFHERREWAVVWQYNKKQQCFICEDGTMRVVGYERLQRGGFARCIQLRYDHTAETYAVDPKAQITDGAGFEHGKYDGTSPTVTTIDKPSEHIA